MMEINSLINQERKNKLDDDNGEAIELKMESSEELCKKLDELALLGKIITNKTHSSADVHSSLQQVWDVGEFTSVEIGNNVFLFTFKTSMARDTVENGAPWAVSGNHLVLKRWKRGCVVEEFDFNTTWFWIQIHGLPLDMMTSENALLAFSLVGECLEVDEKGHGVNGWCKFLRGKVSVKVSEPLKLGFLLNRNGKGPVWVHFKYEKLPVFCYGCGVISHEFESCSSVNGAKFDISLSRYGSWLKAEVQAFYGGNEKLKSEFSEGTNQNQNIGGEKNGETKENSDVLASSNHACQNENVEVKGMTEEQAVTATVIQDTAKVVVEEEIEPVKIVTENSCEVDGNEKRMFDEVNKEILDKFLQKGFEANYVPHCPKLRVKLKNEPSNGRRFVRVVRREKQMNIKQLNKESSVVEQDACVFSVSRLSKVLQDACDSNVFISEEAPVNSRT